MTHTSYFPVAILCAGLLATGCAEQTFQMSIMDATVEVTQEDRPTDYGSKKRDFDLTVPAYKEVSADREPAENYARLEVAGEKEHAVIASVQKGTEDITVSSLRHLSRALHKLHLEQIERNRTLLELVIRAHAMKFEAALMEERAKRDRQMAEYNKELAEESEGKALGLAGGVAAGAAAGSVLPGVGTLAGGIVGGLAGLFGGWAKEAAPPEPDLPTDEELVLIASNKVGLGDDPKKALKQLTFALGTKLVKAEVATLETMNAANAIILRRAMFDNDDGIVLAEVAASTYKEVSELYELAGATWQKDQQEWEEASKLHKRATKAWKATRNQIITTIVVAGVIQTFTEYSGQSTAEYRRSLEAKGIDLSGKDIDHIIPKARVGADHPWNYQAVRSSLNRAWQDGHLFEKCIANPIGFAKGITVSYPGIPGAVAGGVSFWKTVGADDEV